MSSAANRAYMRRFSIAMSCYVIAVIAATSLSNTQLSDGPAIWVIALVPALPLLAVFWAMGRYLAELTDEYIRLLEVRKALVATGCTLAIATVLGFLEIYADPPRLPLFFIPVIWFAGLGVGSLVNAVAERRAAA